jgi:outer membrane usher protein
VRESVRLAAEYRSALFRSPGDSLVSSTGILYPETPYWLRLTGGYSIPIGAGTTASIGARYQFADVNQPTYTPFRIDGDRYGADVTLSSRLGSRLSTSLTAGYSNEITQRAFDNTQANTNPEMRLMLRMFVLPTDNTRMNASYDSLNRSSSVSAYHGVSNGVQRWEADVNAQTDDKAQQKVLNGSLVYSGNRGEIRVAQSASIDDLGGSQGGTFVSDRSSVRFGTAIGFADGRVALGPPIRGNGFALVYPHESLANKEITVGDAAAPRAFVDGLGPALVPDLPAYTPNSISVDVKDLPPGYSLGTGAFDVISPYRAGYALQVGSANSVSAFGTLLFANREPLALTTGVAYPLEKRDRSTKVTVFTNQAGRFVAEGLAPGTWLIEMAAEGGSITYRIEVPNGAQGLLKAGVLTPTATE